MGGWAAFGSAAGSAVGSLAGSALTAVMADRQAHKTRKFLRQMRRTAYQTTMADMKDAGLNPILAYKTGPTNVSGAPMAPTPNFGDSMAAGVKAGADVFDKRTQAGVREKQETQIEAMTRQSVAAGDKAMADAQLADKQSALADLNLQRGKALLPFEIQQGMATARGIEAATRIREAEVPRAQAIGDVFNSTWGKWLAQGSATADTIGDIIGEFSGGLSELWRSRERQKERVHQSHEREMDRMSRERAAEIRSNTMYVPSRRRRDRDR